MITLTSVTLPVASYSKFKPQQVDFLNITNPKAVLEKHLRSFACLSKNDMISIDYLGKEYELQIVETKESHQHVHVGLISSGSDKSGGDSMILTFNVHWPARRHFIYVISIE